MRETSRAVTMPGGWAADDGQGKTVAAMATPRSSARRMDDGRPGNAGEMLFGMSGNLTAERQMTERLPRGAWRHAAAARRERAGRRDSEN